MATQPVRKCRCASDTHGHKAGECTNLVILPELSLCKPCFDKSLEELNDLGPKRSKKDERKKAPQSIRARLGRGVFCRIAAGCSARLGAFPLSGARSCLADRADSFFKGGREVTDCDSEVVLPIHSLMAAWSAVKAIS